MQFPGLTNATIDWLNLHSMERFKNAKALWNAMPKGVQPAGGMAIMGPLFKAFSDHKTAITKQRKSYDAAVERYVEGGTLLYPFRTKVEEYKAKHGRNVDAPEPVKDYSAKALADRYKKPNYSPYRNSYEMDIMFTENDKSRYLVLININTRYLVVVKIKSKEASEIQRALNEARKKIKIEHIKSDGERGFVAKSTKANIKNNGGISTYSDRSPYTYHNKHVDSVIRTIRNAAGLSNEILNDNDLVQQIVDYYNDTPHSGLPLGPDEIHYTPNEMQNNPDLEWAYIRQKDKELKEVQKDLKANHFDQYAPGDVLMLHLDHGKTDERFKKRRRNFQDIGIFVKYDHGSVRCKRLFRKAAPKEITVPIFYTKFLARSLAELPDKYKKFFNIKD